MSTSLFPTFKVFFQSPKCSVRLSDVSDGTAGASSSQQLKHSYPALLCCSGVRHSPQPRLTYSASMYTVQLPKRVVSLCQFS